MLTKMSGKTLKIQMNLLNPPFNRTAGLNGNTGFHGQMR